MWSNGGLLRMSGYAGPASAVMALLGRMKIRCLDWRQLYRRAEPPQIFWLWIGHMLKAPCELGPRAKIFGGCRGCLCTLGHHKVKEDVERFLAVSLRRKPLSQENWGLVSKDPIFGNPLNNDDYLQCWHPNKQTQQEHWLKMSIANVILRQAFAPRDACRQPGSRYLDGHSHIAVMKVLHDRRVGKSPMVPLQPCSWLTIPMKTCVFPAQVLHPHCTRLLHVYVHGQLKFDLYCYT